MNAPLSGAAIDRLVVANLRRHRTRRGLSAARLALALAIGVPAARLYDIERGYARIQTDTLVACAEAIAVPLERFFEDGAEAEEASA